MTTCNEKMLNLYDNNKDPYGLLYMCKQKTKTFFLRKSNSDPINSISATYKNSEGCIGQLKITRVHSKWYTEWEDATGEPIEIYRNTIFEIVNETFPNYKFLVQH